MALDHLIRSSPVGLWYPGLAFPVRSWLTLAMGRITFAAYLCFVAVGLLGCAQQQYWVKPGVGWQQTGQDLSECRKGAGNLQVMVQVEQPCMYGKGYTLSTSPPTAP